MTPQRYVFVLGRTPELAFLELRTLFPGARRVTDEIVSIDGLVNVDISAVMQALGGTVKIAQYLDAVRELTPECFVRLLRKESSPVTFGMSAYSASIPNKLLPQVKQQLGELGVSGRYVESRHENKLSSVVVDKKHVVEYIVVGAGAGFLIAKTVAVQPFETWGQRDYGRPHADAKTGMLPPKVARMVVNIAASRSYGEPRERQQTLFDPFCGMGTILSEAYMTGWRVIGSDVSEGVAVKAKENLSWLASREPKTGGSIAKIHIADATHASDHVATGSVDAIVTEPFMGTTRWGGNEKLLVTSDKLKDLKNTIKGLEKLYIGCLRDWQKVLVPGGKVVIALPAYAVSGREYFVKKVIDMCENLGYTIVDGPIEYSRPQAVVRRKFYILRKFD